MTPTMINAAFNFANFWDGRANNIFNGIDPFGRRNPNAKIIEKQEDDDFASISVEFENSSLASQAVGPPLSEFEMSCIGRTFPKVGKKMLSLSPLQHQLVDPDDSVLGPLSNAPSQGLASNYEDMVKAAFHPRFWDADALFNIDHHVIGSGQPSDTDEFTLMEMNFSMFWGLAIQLYEETLISDDTPFDRYADGDEDAMSDEQKAGLAVFMGQGRCVNCHSTAMFTKASTLHLIDEKEEEGLVERMLMGDESRGPALYDNGFYNIGVRPTHEDLGRGGNDPFGNDLSFSRQYMDQLRGRQVPDPFEIDPCTFDIRFTPESAGDLDGDGLDDPFPTGTTLLAVPCKDDTSTLEPGPPQLSATPEEQDDLLLHLRHAVDGAFKVSTLRNVELTGPYFHNGGQATLEQVVEFYNRGGDFAHTNQRDLDPDIRYLGLSDSQQAYLVAFLKALTDHRVECEMAPFDHPQLFIPNGHPDDEVEVIDTDGDGIGDDSLLVFPAVGAGGLPEKGLACLKNFLE